MSPAKQTAGPRVWLAGAPVTSGDETAESVQPGLRSALVWLARGAQHGHVGRHFQLVQPGPGPDAVAERPRSEPPVCGALPVAWLVDGSGDVLARIELLANGPAPLEPLRLGLKAGIELPS